MVDNINIQIAKELEAGIISGNEDRLIHTLKSKLSDLSDIDKIIRARAILKQNVKKKIEFGKPFINIRNNPLFFPRTINVIQGKSGTHKSRIAEHICSTILKKNINAPNLLDMESSIKTKILYVDTERNLSEQFPYSLQQILINAGYKIEDNIEPEFDFISLIDIERGKRFEAFKVYLDSLREGNNDHIIVILDVLTDLIENFNDPKDSLKLIDLLNGAINNYNITFICIIHENPFQEKARGHLGTEIMNKSSVAISINFEKDKSGGDQDIIKLNFLKCRSSKRMESLYVKYDDETKTLVYCSPIEIEKAVYSKDMKANIFDIAKFVVENIKGQIKKKELIQLLAQEFSCTSRTIEDRLKDLRTGIGIHILWYSLDQVKSGKEVYYKLIGYNENEIIQEDIF